MVAVTEKSAEKLTAGYETAWSINSKEDKNKIDSIIFSELTIKKKRIALRKLRKDGLEPKYINMFIGLLDFIQKK